VTFEDAVAETERLFLEAVKLRLDADVPVGSLLSGGVDSSLVCWAVSALGANITAFTIGAHGDPLDETADARQTARQLGIRHEVIDLSPDETPSIDDMSSAYGEPFACASALGMMRVSKAVRSSATVLLTGDGGDDVFLGYPEHRYFQTGAGPGQASASRLRPVLAGHPAGYPKRRHASPRRSFSGLCNRRSGIGYEGPSGIECLSAIRHAW
jgi:asparagine synthetase B (glutamine-hydrolysing)